MMGQWARWLLLVVVAGAGGYLYQAQPRSGVAAPPAVRPVPVQVQAVVRKTLPVRLSAVGRAQAAASVTLKSRVDGQLLEAHFKEGQLVHQGELLFRIDPRPLEAALALAQANLGRDQAQLDKARLQLRRQQGLAPKGYVSGENLEDARATAEALEATIRADQAAVELARLQLGYATLHAPITGLAGARLADPGNLVKTNETPLAVINQVEPLYLVFALPERYLPELRRRLASGMLKVEADAQDGGGPVVGEVEFLDNRIDPATGTIALRAIFANQDQRLHPGQFLRLDLLLGELTDVPVIPVQAVQAGQRGDQVYLVSPDRRAELRPVTLGPRVGDEVAVSAGLEGGEQLVIDGQARLAKGVKLDLKEADPAAGQ